jgi:hypothetical protein
MAPAFCSRRLGGRHMLLAKIGVRFIRKGTGELAAPGE